MSWPAWFAIESMQPLWYPAASPIQGRGVFAAHPLVKGQIIGLAHYLNGREWKATELGALHNHSLTPTAGNHLFWDPNARAFSRFLYALRSLAPGEEITVDYRLQPEFEQPAAGWR